MAGPIKISILADVGQAVKNVTKFSDTVDENTHRVVTGLGDSKLSGGFGKVQEGFDVLDTRAMGFRDTVTGVQDSLAGFNALMGQGEHASDSMYDKLVLMGTGVGDLASGMANFIVPMMAVGQSLSALSLASIRATASMVAQKVAMVAGTVATGAATVAQWALNVALSANPIGLIILAIVALVAAIVVLWKKNEAFRNFVTAVWNAIWGSIKAVWDWIKGNWPKLLSILTGPIGIAVRWIVRHWQQIVDTVKALPGKIKAAFGNAKNLLIQIGKDMISGLINGIKNMAGAAKDAAINVAKSAVDGMKSMLHIGSPSKVFAEIGGFMGAGLVQGLDDAGKDVREATEGLVSIPGAGLSASVAVDGPSTPAWARELIRLLSGGLRLSVESDGTPAGDALAALLAEVVRIRGGDSSVLGITQVA